MTKIPEEKGKMAKESEMEIKLQFPDCFPAQYEYRTRTAAKSNLEYYTTVHKNNKYNKYYCP